MSALGKADICDAKGMSALSTKADIPRNAMSTFAGCHTRARSRLIARRRVPKFFQSLLDREAAGLLARWELPEARQMLCHERLRRDKDEGVLHEPSYIIAR
jgi:hypothetical protein